MNANDFEKAKNLALALNLKNTLNEMKPTEDFGVDFDDWREALDTVQRMINGLFTAIEVEE